MTKLDEVELKYFYFIKIAMIGRRRTTYNTNPSGNIFINIFIQLTTHDTSIHNVIIFDAIPPSRIYSHFEKFRLAKKITRNPLLYRKNFLSSIFNF